MKATKVTDMVCGNVSECRPVKKDFRTFVNKALHTVFRIIVGHKEPVKKNHTTVVYIFICDLTHTHTLHRA